MRQTPNPLWKRRRWRVLAAIWLALPLVYAAGDGPLLYAVYRGWVPFDTWRFPYEWTRGRLINGSAYAKAYGDYISWWTHLGLCHGSPLAPPPPDCQD